MSARILEEPTFVGRNRKKLVDGLVSIYDDVKLECPRE